MVTKLVWARDGADWPHREASRFVRAGGFEWHVQIMGDGPVLLLLHGTGAATHSWRDLMPLLAADFTVVAPDLPGHGFTATPPAAQMSLPGMARAVAALLKMLDVKPEIVVGHSAGSAIAARMCLDGLIAPRALISFNGALLPLAHMPSELFAPLARLMASMPLVPRIASRQAGKQNSVERLIAGTGSVLDADGVKFYRRVVGSSGHVNGALVMMANWGLRDLARDLPRLKVPLTLVTGSADRTVPPQDAQRLHRLLPGATLVSMPGLGHLAHEEQPARAAEIIRETVGTVAPT